MGNGYLNVDLRGALLYNTFLKEITLDSMFRNTKKPYLLLDFCGSWSVHCMKKIAEFSRGHRADKSKTVRPVWLFFENNQEDWLKVIKKYNLPEQDCFLVRDTRKMIKGFSSEYNWHRDFPHYYLFSKEGRCINENAASFYQLDLKSIPTK